MTKAVSRRNLTAWKTRLDSILQAVKDAGYKAGSQIFLALDVASSEFYNGNGTYTFKKSTGKKLSGEELVDFYVNLWQVSDREHRRWLRGKRLEDIGNC